MADRDAEEACGVSGVMQRIRMTSQFCVLAVSYCTIQHVRWPLAMYVKRWTGNGFDRMCQSPYRPLTVGLVVEASQSPILHINWPPPTTTQ